ncbi:hypothetical protein PHMEG_00025224 [Phytophthora megakarya]|uniref:CCHC-type domain-containing protein n=1 Tax=Phytophthora megakarya TaxID=4795 RepID=A0A225VBM2_9STRA|nr:hypothetical protein PHMEG_00025224 [Phytophthora megakarya]
MSGGFTFSSVMTGGQATIPLPVVMGGSQSSMAGVSAAAMPSFTTLPGTGMAHSYGYGFPTGVYGSGATGTYMGRSVGGGGGGIKDISNKPPVMKSSFDLYAVQLKTYLTRLGVWSLIDGTEIRPLYDVNLQADFDARDNAAREAILRGVPEVDAELICHEISAKDMWVRFENKQTKREYANYIFAREQLYSSKYSRDLDMTDWLREIQLKRRELSHYGKVISDEEFAEILLANVTRTHRDVVRQFSRHYAALALPGTQLMPPTSAQVMNALLAEEALDEKVADAPRAIGSTSKQKTNSGADCGGNSKKKRRGKYKAKQKDKDGNSGKTKKVVCWKCGEQGHIRPNCPNEKSDDGSQNQNQKQSAGMEAKRWQNKQEGKGGKKSVDALTVRKIGATAVGTRSRKARITEWVLDTATDVHVCTDMSLLDNPQRDKEHLFLDFDGQPKGERLVGDVRVIVTNVNGNQEEALPLVAKRDTSALERWHLRYAHLNYPALRQMISHETATGFVGLDSGDAEEPIDKCWTCRASKLKRMSYKKTLTRRSTECYQKLMSDMCYVGVETHNGYKHFQLIQDEATRYVWGFLMKAKEEATTVAMSHVKWLLAQGHRVEVFSCDRGKELS